MATNAEMSQEIARLKAQIANGGKTKGRSNPGWIVKAEANPDGTYTLVLNPRVCGQFSAPIPTKGGKVAWQEHKASFVGFGPSDAQLFLIHPAFSTPEAAKVS